MSLPADVHMSKKQTRSFMPHELKDRAETNQKPKEQENKKKKEK